MLFFIVKEARNLYKTRLEYFKQFWNYVEIVIITMSACAIAMYLYRIYVALELTEKFAKSHGNEYMKFQYVGTSKTYRNMGAQNRFFHIFRVYISKWRRCF